MNIKQKYRVNSLDVEMLMASMLGKLEEYEDDEIEMGAIEEEFIEKFEVDQEQFHKIVEHLMPYTVLSKSELSETLRIGFVDHANGVYLAKAEMNEH